MGQVGFHCQKCKASGNNRYQIMWRGSSGIALDGAGVKIATYANCSSLLHTGSLVVVSLTPRLWPIKSSQWCLVTFSLGLWWSSVSRNHNCNSSCVCIAAANRCYEVTYCDTWGCAVYTLCCCTWVRPSRSVSIHLPAPVPTPPPSTGFS